MRSRKGHKITWAIQGNENSSVQAITILSLRFHMQGSKKLHKEEAPERQTGWFYRFSWLVECNICVQGRTFRVILFLENIWNKYECGRFLKGLPLSRWNGVMTLSLTDQWPGMPSNYMHMVFENLSGKVLLEKEEASFLTM